MANGMQHTLDNYRQIAGKIKIDVVRKFINKHIQEWESILNTDNTSKPIRTTRGINLGHKNEPYSTDENDYGTSTPTPSFHHQVQRMNKIGFK